MWGVVAVHGSHWVCHSPGQLVLPGSTLLMLQGALQGLCPEWTLHFKCFPGLSHSGNQVLGECAVPGGPCIFIAPPVLATLFPGCVVRAPFQVYHVSPLGSWFQAATLLVDVNHPGSQEDVVSNWETAHSLVEDAVSGAKLQQPLAFWLWLSHACPSASKNWGAGPMCSRLALLWYLLNPLLCEWTLRWSHDLGCYLMLAPSDCPQGIRAWSLP